MPFISGGVLWWLAIWVFNLREFALCYDRNPESMRTVPRVCPAGRDSTFAVGAVASGKFQIASFQEGEFADAPPFRLMLASNTSPNERISRH